MLNPFEVIDRRLASIEDVLQDLRRSQINIKLPAQHDEDKFIGVQDAALFLNIKPQTVYQNIDKIPHEKRHGKLYFTRRQLRNYLIKSTE